jgi:hypothetical protein
LHCLYGLSEMAGTTLAAYGGSPGHDDSTEVEDALAARRPDRRTRAFLADECEHLAA